MDDTDMIADVRRAKEWLDQSCTSFRELGERLAEIERAYSSRSGGFAQIPLARTEAVRRQIEGAADEPGGELLQETRSPKDH